MDLESIMLSERNQRLKATYCMILFLGNVQNRQICRDRKQMYSCQWVERKKNWEVWGFLLWWWKCSGMIWWWWLHNIVNIPKPTVLHIVTMLYELYLSKKMQKTFFLLTLPVPQKWDNQNPQAYKNLFIVFAKVKYIHSHRIIISHILRWTISILTLLKIQTPWLYLYLYYQESFCAQIMTHKIHLKFF